LPEAEGKVKADSSLVACPNLEKRLFHSLRPASGEDVLDQSGCNLPAAKGRGGSDIQDVQFASNKPGANKPGKLLVNSPEVDTGKRIFQFLPKLPFCPGVGLTGPFDSQYVIHVGRGHRLNPKRPGRIGGGQKVGMAGSYHAPFSYRTQTIADSPGLYLLRPWPVPRFSSQLVRIFGIEVKAMTLSAL
jgi:hypothetical protein